MKNISIKKLKAVRGGFGFGYGSQPWGGYSSNCGCSQGKKDEGGNDFFMIFLLLLLLRPQEN